MVYVGVKLNCVKEEENGVFVQIRGLDMFQGEYFGKVGIGFPYVVSLSARVR